MIQNRTLSVFSLVLLLIVTTLSSCKKKEDSTVVVETINTTIYGKVVDEYGIALQGAIVNVGDFSTTSDQQGFYYFNNIKTTTPATIVHVKLYNFFDGSRTVFVKANQKQEVKIALLNKQFYAQTFSSSAGGTITTTEGVSLTFLSNSIKDKKSGALYNGQVKVYARKIDPTTKIGRESMPGDLIGLPMNGTGDKILTSFGMITVELNDGNGNELQITDGKDVTMEMNIPTSLLNSAPSHIPLWYYDEAKGKWIEEGSADLNGNKYIGKVKHFSFWNFDIFGEAVFLEANFIDQNNTPLSGCRAEIVNSSNTNTFIRDGNVNSNGWFGGFVPASTTITINFYSYFCSLPIYTQTVTTGRSNINLGIVPVTMASVTTVITGTVVGCNAQPLGSSLLQLEDGINQIIGFVPTDSLGNFSYSVCNNNSFRYIKAFDLSSNVFDYQQPAIIYGTTNNVGNLSVCSSNSNTPFVRFVLRNITSSQDDSVYYSFPTTQTQFSGTYLSSGGGLLFKTFGKTLGTFNVVDANLNPFSSVTPFNDSIRLSQAGPSSITFTSFPSTPNQVTGSFSVRLKGYRSQNEYTAIGTFRANQ